MTMDRFQLVGEEVQSEPYNYRACGLEGIYLLNGYRIEYHEDEKHISVSDIDGLHRAIGKHLVLHRKALAPNEIKFIRKTMDLTQAELAGRLGNTSQSVARWEKGEVGMPGPEEKLLRVTFLASLLTDGELNALRDLLTKTLVELDALDQASPPPAQFQFGDEWIEKRAA